MNRQYIGARYVPTFFDNNGSNEWVQGIPYEPLTIVTFMRNSYTSRIPVPANIGNPTSTSGKEYWVLTGAYNQQLEDYHTEFENFKDDANQQFTVINNTFASLPEEIKNTVDEAIEDANIPAIKDLSAFKNKKICIIGDSITSESGAGSWANPFKTIVETVGATVLNIAQDGSSFASWRNKLTEIPANYDMYIVMLGVNDFQGQFLWTTGAANSVIDSFVFTMTGIMDKNKAAKFYYISPIKCWYAENNINPLSFFRSYYEKGASQFGYTVISGYNAWDLSVHTKDIYMTDNLHPTAAYAPILANYIIDAIIGGVSTFSEQPIDFFVYNGCNIFLDPNNLEMLISINRTFSPAIGSGWINIAPLPNFFSDYRHIDLVVPSYQSWTQSGTTASSAQVAEINVNNTTGFIQLFITHASTTKLRSAVRAKSYVINRQFTPVIPTEN